MKTKNFRIGNLILVNDVVQEIVELPLPENCTKDNTKGILLNEDWLFKLGFEKFVFRVNETYQKTSDILYRIEIGTGSWLTISCDGNMPISFPMIKDEKQESHYLLRGLSYVHQLQNLFFVLRDQELTVKHEVSV